MLIKSLNGDDEINEVCNAAMNAVINALVSEGKLYQDQADEFLDTHFCLLVCKESGIKSWLRRRFKTDADMSRVICARVEKP